MIRKPDKIGQEHRINIHQSQNNTPFIKNSRYEVQTMDLQWIFKNEEHGDRSHAITLLARHNPVAKVVYKELKWELNGSEETTYKAPSQVTKVKETEVWWDMPISTLNKIPHNRPDMIIWHSDTKDCKIVDICVPLDTSVELRHTTKIDDYNPLSISCGGYTLRTSILSFLSSLAHLVQYQRH